MMTFEKKIAEFFEKNVLTIAFATGLIVSLLIRLSAYSFISSDMSGFLIGWFGQIEQLGRFKALSVQVGNYSVAYQTLIALMTYIPVDPVYQYKTLSVIFDYSLALGVYFLVFELKNHDRKIALLSFLAVVFSPLVFMNSSLWGQCDSIYTSFIVWSLYFFIKKKYPVSFILYGLACAFKLQAVFFLPFLLFSYVRKKDFSIFNFLLIPFVMEFVCIPAMCVGRGFKAAFSVYYYQTESCDKMYFSYPSFWALFSDLKDISLSRDFIDGMKIAAVLLTFSIIMILMCVMFLKKFTVNEKNALYIAFILVYTCVLFLPGMHERYGFVYEILAIAIAFLIPKTVWALVAISSLTCITYGISLFGNMNVTPLMSIINIIAYIYYIVVLYKSSEKE